MKEWFRELQTNRRAYYTAPKAVRLQMEQRALTYASLCIHTSWRASVGYLQENRLNPLPVARLFLQSRFVRRPGKWGNSPKARFARALCGAYQKDDACRDVLMMKHFPKAKVTTVGQWALWLHKAYPKSHKNEAKGKVLREHCEILRWVRTGQKQFEQEELTWT